METSRKLFTGVSRVQKSDNTKRSIEVDGRIGGIKILRGLDLITEETTIFTTVHDFQIVDEFPKEEHDFVVDAIITPNKVVRVERKYPQPKGIIWEKLMKHQLRNIPTLQEFKKRTITHF